MLVSASLVVAVVTISLDIAPSIWFQPRHHLQMRSMEGLPTYSTLEVAKHATPEDAWLIIGGKVLNVSSWLDEHPGGDVVLLDLAGRDATREFEDVGHSGDARSRLDSLVIGTVRPATDEELRISRGENTVNGKPANGSSATNDALATLMRANFTSIKKIGAISAAGAAVLLTAVVLQRYGGRYFYRGTG